MGLAVLVGPWREVGSWTMCSVLAFLVSGSATGASGATDATEANFLDTSLPVFLYNLRVTVTLGRESESDMLDLYLTPTR